MAAIGLVSSIADAALAIDFGRKGFATKGKAEEGRVLYEEGIALAMSSFKEAQSTADPHILILVEYTFLTQELQFCHEKDKNSRNSLTQAIQNFDDAFLVLEIVEDKNNYKFVDKSHPRYKDYRVGVYPKDSFHVACSSHKTRIKNMLRTPGVDPIEKDLLEQRFSNLSTAQSGYIEKQKKVMEK